MTQFAYVAVYYLTGDVLSYVLLRAIGDALTVLAVRLPPPGARLARADIPGDAPAGGEDKPKDN